MQNDPVDPLEPLEGKTVLLADDEERLRTVVEMMLEELGARVVVVDGGQGALDVFESDPEGFDLVMLDLRMQGVSGVDAFRRLRKTAPHVPVLLTSGAVPDDELLGELAASGAGFLEKPFNVDRLGEVLRRLTSRDA